MRATAQFACLLALWSFVGVTARGFSEDRDVRGGTQASAAQEQSETFRFILFWKAKDAATAEMASSLKSAVAKSQRATWTDVNIADESQRAVVKRYDVSRAPMPMVLCVAPNGAVTAAITEPVTDDAVDDALVTQAMADCMKAMQDGKIVLLHIKKDRRAAWPKGADEFSADPLFESRTAALALLADDPAEARFLNELEIDSRKVKGSLLAVLAPPGGLVGKFSANVTKDQIAAKLHAAGECCEDPNCKHSKKGK